MSRNPDGGWFVLTSNRRSSTSREDRDPLWFSVGKVSGSDELISTGTFTNSYRIPLIPLFYPFSSLAGADMAAMVESTTSSIHALETSQTASSPHCSRHRHHRHGPSRQCGPHGTRRCARDCLAKLPNVLRVSPLLSRAGARRRACGLLHRRRAVCA